MEAFFYSLNWAYDKVPIAANGKSFCNLSGNSTGLSIIK